jgi:hypothetical protein
MPHKLPPYCCALAEYEGDSRHATICREVALSGTAPKRVPLGGAA